MPLVEEMETLMPLVEEMEMSVSLVGRPLVGEGASGDSAFLPGCATRPLQRILAYMNISNFLLCCPESHF